MTITLVGYVGYVMHRSPNGPTPHALEVASAFFGQTEAHDEHCAMLDVDFEECVPLSLGIKHNTGGWKVLDLSHGFHGPYQAGDHQSFTIEVEA